MKFVTILIIFSPVLVTAQFLSPVFQDSVFTVTAHMFIRQGKPYNIFVRGFNLNRTLTVTTRLIGQSDTGVAVNFSRTANVSPAVPRVSLSIPTTTITNGNYSLLVESINYSQRRTLVYIKKKYVFLIQFNKNTLFPNDILQYRIYAIDSETLAVNPIEPNNITIFDSKNTIVGFSSNATFTKGKYENKFQIPKNARLGGWRLTFQSGEERVQRDFIIADYKLSSISGQLTIPEETPKSAGKVLVTIDINYVLGGNPIGTASIMIFNRNRQNILTKNIQINSAKTSFDIDIVNELQLISEDHGFFEAQLFFQDPITGDKLNIRKDFYVGGKLYKMFISYNNEVYYPGNPHKFTVTVKKYDGSPAPAGTKIEITPVSPTTIPAKTLYLGTDGRVSSSIDIPINTTSNVNMNVETDNADFDVISLRPSWKASYSAKSIDVKVFYQNDGYMDIRSKLNEPVKIMLISSDVVDYAVVHIVSKGVLLKTLTVPFDSDMDEDNNPKTVVFSFTPTIQYAPNALVIAYYVDKNGTIVAGIKQVQIAFDLPNYVKIKPNNIKVKPGSDLKLNIESYINSTVSLMAVDQRILLLGNGKSVSNEDVYKDFSSFPNEGYAFPPIMDYYTNFASVGLYFLSNIPSTIPRSLTDTIGATLIKLISQLGGAGLENYLASLNIPPVQTRLAFQDTFLWRDVDIKNTLYDDVHYNDETSQFGYETITEKVPDSISNYFIYGVSMSSTKGMGLSENVPSTSIFLPFFISFEFPFSVKRNETLVQDIYIYNFLPQSQIVAVLITVDPRFDAVDLATYGWTAVPGYYAKILTTTIGQHVNLKFAIRPKVLGFIPFKITARGPLAGDGLEKPLRVIPDGILRSLTDNVWISVDKPATTAIVSLQCTLPTSAYLDTAEVYTTVYGAGFKSLNLDKLIQVPSGSCDQIVSALMPNIVVYLYLSSSNKLTTAMRTTLVANIGTGYQNILSCQKVDGSFSAFTNGTSSTWVTAYVTQYLNIASNIITVDPKVVSKGADFVVKQQNSNGSFNETGKIINGNMQVASGNGRSLTAFCSIMLSGLFAKYPQYATARTKSVTYLESQLSSVFSVYEFAIFAYAFQLAGSVKANDAYNLFYFRRTEKSLTITWNEPYSPITNYSQYPARSPFVEIASYGLFNVIKKGEILERIVKIASFINSQGNIYGDYGPSYDTVIALNALSEFARSSAFNGSLTVSIAPNAGTPIAAQVTPANMQSIQTFQLNSTARIINIRGTSTTSALAVVGLTCNFYEDPSQVIQQFNITYQFVLSCYSYFVMNICVKNIPNETSSLAKMSVKLPSGYSGTINTPIHPDVKVAEVTNQGSEVLYHFNGISNSGTCLTVNATKTHIMNDLKDGLIQAYLYIDIKKEGVVSYSLPDYYSNCGV